MLLLRVGRASGFFRTAFYLPNVTPAVAVGTLFLLLLAGNGLINQVLGAFGIDGPNWLTDPTWVKPGIVIMSLWTLGATVVIYFAALRNVPVELYEAAQIDGASAWAQFQNITLPFISGAIFFTRHREHDRLAPDLRRGLHDVLRGEAAGAGQEAALFYTIYLFQKAFQDLDFGYASAMALAAVRDHPRHHAHPDPAQQPLRVLRGRRADDAPAGGRRRAAAVAGGRRRDGARRSAPGPRTARAARTGLVSRILYSARWSLATLIFVFPFVWLLSASLKTRSRRVQQRVLHPAAAVRELQRASSRSRRSPAGS